MWKKLGLGVVVLLAVIASAVWFAVAHIERDILTSIEQDGSTTTAKVTVGNVAVSLLSGELVISGLIVGNPPGFSTPYAVALGTIIIHGEIGSLFGGNPIRIDQVDIDRPHIFYEVTGRPKDASLSSLNLGTTSNLGTLQRNAANSPDTGPTRKEIINVLTVTGGEISISSPLLLGKVLTEKLPVIHLTGIGETTGGVTTGQASTQVLTAITNEAAFAGAASLVRALGAAAAAPFDGAITKKLKSLF